MYVSSFTTCVGAMHQALQYNTVGDIHVAWHPYICSSGKNIHGKDTHDKATHHLGHVSGCNGNITAQSMVPSDTGAASCIICTFCAICTVQSNDTFRHCTSSHLVNNILKSCLNTVSAAPCSYCWYFVVAPTLRAQHPCGQSTRSHYCTRN